MNRSSLLVTDAAINLGLGLLLVWFPDSLVQILGVPATDSGFYPAILGAVLFGIGIALLIEAKSTSRETAGLGLSGAMAINLCGGAVLGAWLVLGGLDLPLRGTVLLWVLVVVLVGISLLEVSQAKRRADD